MYVYNIHVYKSIIVRYLYRNKISVFGKIINSEFIPTKNIWTINFLINKI